MLNNVLSFFLFFAALRFFLNVFRACFCDLEVDLALVVSLVEEKNIFQILGLVVFQRLFPPGASQVRFGFAGALLKRADTFSRVVVVVFFSRWEKLLQYMGRSSAKSWRFVRVFIGFHISKWFRSVSWCFYLALLCFGVFCRDLWF